MAWKAYIFKRDELYEQVWTMPMCLLAKEYHLSDSGLAKICRKLEIPRPGRGYWERKKAGQNVKQEPLPPLSPGTRSQYQTSRWRDPAAAHGFGDEAAALLEREDDPSMAIVVPAELEQPHHWIRKSGGWLKRNSRTQAKLRGDRACLDITASRVVLDRALRIAGTLLKALEERGFKVEITDPVPYAPGRYGGPASGCPSQTGVHILGTFIEFGIEEGVNIIKEEQDPVSYGSSSHSYTPAPEYQHEPDGKLALKIRTTFPDMSRRTWGDGKRQRVENCLKPFVIALIQGAERIRLDRLERERQQREREDEQRRRQKEAHRRELKKARRDDLYRRTESWNRASRIQEFIAEVETEACARGDDTSHASPLGQWLVWAKAHAKDMSEVALKIKPEPID